MNRGNLVYTVKLCERTEQRHHWRGKTNFEPCSFNPKPSTWFRPKRLLLHRNPLAFVWRYRSIDRRPPLIPPNVETLAAIEYSALHVHLQSCTARRAITRIRSTLRYLDLTWRMIGVSTGGSKTLLSELATTQAHHPNTSWDTWPTARYVTHSTLQVKLQVCTWRLEHITGKDVHGSNFIAYSTLDAISYCFCERRLASKIVRPISQQCTTDFTTLSNV